MPWIARAGLGGALAALGGLVAGCALGDSTSPTGSGGGDATGDTAGATAASSGSQGSSGVPSECSHTTDGFSFQITEGEGQAYGCGAATGKLSLSARVTAASGTSATLATCPDGASCDGTTVTLTIASADLAIALTPEAFVRVEALVQESAAGCVQSLLITNLPAIGAVENPVNTAPILWLAGADGTLATPEGSPLHVGDAPGCGADDHADLVDDDLSFTFAGVSSVPTTVELPMGVPYPVQGPGGETWILLDLRSFHHVGALADDQRDFAYWVGYSP